MYCSLYYYDEIYFVGGAKFFSYPPRNLLHTPAPEFLGQIGLVLTQFAEVFASNAGIFSDHADLTFKPVVDLDEDKALVLQRGDDILNLAFADVKKISKVFIAGVTTALVIERVNFLKQNFFYD